MPREVDAEVDKNGKVSISYGGFQGQACYLKAREIYRKLQEFGVDVKVEEERPVTAIAIEQRITEKEQ